jgi:hypothetical protein
MDCISSPSNAMQISDLYRQTKIRRDPAAHAGRGTFPAGRAEYKQVT